MSDSSGRFSDAPISRLVGFDVLSPDPTQSDGHAVVQIESSARHHNPMGRVHGGLISALADAAMGIAFGRTLFPEQDFSTVEMSVRFMRPVREGMLTATAKVIERGLRVGFVDCEITDQRGKRIATASCTCTVL
ncbi:MAG: PaaI family thioesterase [Planctomycetota bacterium]